MKRERSKLKICDTCIIFLIFVISVLVFFKISPTRKKAILAKAFLIPNKVTPDYKNSEKRLSSNLKKMTPESEVLFVSACSHLEKKEHDLSFHFINQAIALAPGEKKYYSLKKLITAKKNNLEAFHKVQELFNNKEFGGSWNFFESCCSNNYLFFSEYGSLYANLLEKNGCIASSTLLLDALAKSGVIDG